MYVTNNANAKFSAEMLRHKITNLKLHYEVQSKCTFYNGMRCLSVRSGVDAPVFEVGIDYDRLKIKKSFLPNEITLLP